MTKRTPLYLLLSMAMLLSSLPALMSCNKSDDEDDEYTYSTSQQTTLVTGFSLQANSEVLTNLDSVFFTVDYDNGLIYNADSLPVGTDVSALKITIDFLNTVRSAVVTITGATSQADTTINYTSTTSANFDFTGKTVLTVTSYDQSQVKDYEIKVLVHKQNPDSLIWDQSWRRDLPGYTDQYASKTVMMGDNYVCMLYNGTQAQFMSATAPNQGTWDKVVATLPFKPQTWTLTATDDALFVLGEDGVLYTSVNFTDWSSCGVTWVNVLGQYDGRVLGILYDAAANDYFHDEYPRSEDFEYIVVEDGFPIYHSSAMIEADSKWSTSNQAMIVGGKDRNGNNLSNVWGYDGTQWGQINNIHSSSLPALADATVFPYYTYKTLSGTRRYGRQLTWYLMGGRYDNGMLNDSIYVSNTRGVTWSTADSTLFQPAHMPKFYGAQAFVNFETLSANGTANAPRRVVSFDGTWECPFIYLFGGFNEQGNLLPYVWRGVYNRMTNYPVF